MKKRPEVVTARNEGEIAEVPRRWCWPTVRRRSADQRSNPSSACAEGLVVVLANDDEEERSPHSDLVSSRRSGVIVDMAYSAFFTRLGGEAISDCYGKLFSRAG